MMFRLLIFLFSFGLMVSCKSQEGPRNKYLEAKNHPSDKLSSENQKATKKAKRDFVKTQKQNNKTLNKKGSIWSKKKKQYT